MHLSRKVNNLPSRTCQRQCLPAYEYLSDNSSQVREEIYPFLFPKIYTFPESARLRTGAYLAIHSQDTPVKKKYLVFLYKVNPLQHDAIPELVVSNLPEGTP